MRTLTAPAPPTKNGLRRPTTTLTFPELFALPTTVDLATAASAFGFSLSTAYRLVARNAFPCAILRPTWRYRIPTSALLRALDIEDTPVYAEDVSTDINHAWRSA